MTPTDTVARRAITEALRGSDRVRFSRFSVSRCALGALLLAIALSFEVWPAIQGHYPWYSAAATVLFSLLGILAFAVAWGSDRNAAAQLQDRELLVWDWRGRASSIPYEGVQAVRVRKCWDSWLLSVYRGAGGEDPAWRRAIWYPSRDGWLITAIAGELAGRCGLVARCEGLWARSPVEDVPEPMGSE